MLIATMAGSGWLRTRLYGSPADYNLRIENHVTGDLVGQRTAAGTILAEYLTMLAAQSAGTATLLLANGMSLKVHLTSVGSSEAMFEVTNPAALPIS